MKTTLLLSVLFLFAFSAQRCGEEPCADQGGYDRCMRNANQGYSFCVEGCQFWGGGAGCSIECRTDRDDDWFECAADFPGCW